jgi:hypothetical protein
MKEEHVIVSYRKEQRTTHGRTQEEDSRITTEEYGILLTQS